MVTGAFVLVIISAATQGLAPYLIGRAVDEFISKGNQPGLAYTMAALVLVYVVGMFATRYQIYWMSKRARGAGRSAPGGF